MEQESPHSVLSRLLRKAGKEAAPQEITPARALRLSMARASERSIGLSVTVKSVTEELVPLDDCLAALNPDLMLLELRRGSETLGLAAFDLQLRAAAVEVQTIGVLRSDPAPEREITTTDAALCSPLVTGFLNDLSRTGEETDLDGWSTGIVADRRLEDSRAAGMIIEDCPMRMVRLSVDLGATERAGSLTIVLPNNQVPPAIHTPQSDAPFTEKLRDAVMQAPAELNAVLHRMQLSLRDVRQFDVGQVLNMPGITVGSLRLEAQDGKCIGHGRLGQVTGLRAIRMHKTAPLEMNDTAAGVVFESADIGSNNHSDTRNPTQSDETFPSLAAQASGADVTGTQSALEQLEAAPMGLLATDGSEDTGFAEDVSLTAQHDGGDAQIGESSRETEDEVAG